VKTKDSSTLNGWRRKAAEGVGFKGRRRSERERDDTLEGDGLESSELGEGGKTAPSEVEFRGDVGPLKDVGLESDWIEVWEEGDAEDGEKGDALVTGRDSEEVERDGDGRAESGVGEWEDGGEEGRVDIDDGG